MAAVFWLGSSNWDTRSFTSAGMKRIAFDIAVSETPIKFPNSPREIRVCSTQSFTNTRRAATNSRRREPPVRSETSK
ncbi:MAG: hypothetical protein Q8M06_07510, partial [Methanobacteriaceae archaeon]|nr:hypothetical protein [Methanobacteriaceae archaeon]